MGSNIFAKSGKEQEIFRDERFLYPEYLPEKLPHRESEIDSLVYAFQPVLKGKKPSNVFVVGDSGTGKTVTVKYVLNELESYSDRAKSLYINCFECNTRYAVLAKITNFMKIAIPRRGLATDEVYSKFLEGLKKTDFTPLVVLDEVEQLLAREEASKLFYDLLRIVEHQQNNIGLIFISNDFSFTSKLDSRVKSSLAEETIEFRQYSPQQLKDILRERAQYAYAPNVLEEDVINVAAAHAAKKKGDARIAIECLWKAGREAERQNSAKVTLDHLRSAFEKVDARSAEKILPYLSENETMILKLIAEQKENETRSGKLYELYSKTSPKPVTQRSFRDTIAKLESAGVISAPILEKGIKGRTKMISLKISKETALKPQIRGSEGQTKPI